jgi:hypothetical protein
LSIREAVSPVILRYERRGDADALRNTGNRARPVLLRAVKSSFTIRVDRLFTAWRDDAFTKALHRSVKTPVFA